MNHPWDDRYPYPLWGSRTPDEPPSRRERVWIALLLSALLLASCIDWTGGIK